MSIPQNITDRHAAELLYQEAGMLLAPEVNKLTDGGKLIFWRMMRDLASRALLKVDLVAKRILAECAADQTKNPMPAPKIQQPQQVKPVVAPAAPPKKRRAIRIGKPDDSDVKYALELCEAIDSMADDVPERGSDFADSVRDKAHDIAFSIEEKDFVTEGQINALENMHAGLQRWIDR